MAIKEHTYKIRWKRLPARRGAKKTGTTVNQGRNQKHAINRLRYYDKSIKVVSIKRLPKKNVSRRLS